MNNEFFDALLLIEKEKGIPMDYMLEKIKAAIVIAVKKDFGGNENVNVYIDENTRAFQVTIIKTVVETVEDPVNEIQLDEAKKYSKKAIVGSNIDIKLETKQFGRIAAQAAKHVIKQGIREGERIRMMEQYNNKLHEVVTVNVHKIDSESGNAVVELDKHEMMLFQNEQIPGEIFKVGDKIKVYVADVITNEKRCTLKLTRTHRDLVKRLFEIEVPEIFEGTVEVKSISREAGNRTKIAVYSKDENVDAVGACIGNKGIRVNAVTNEINNEKIDIIRYSEDPAEFIAAALAPSGVVSVDVNTEEKSARVRVPDEQLSLAIGNKGQNAKLAARLTGYKIDIRPESGFFGEEETRDSGKATGENKDLLENDPLIDIEDTKEVASEEMEELSEEV